MVQIDRLVVVPLVRFALAVAVDETEVVLWMWLVRTVVQSMVLKRRLLQVVLVLAWRRDCLLVSHPAFQ